MSGNVANTEQTIIPADAGRPAIRLPLFLLGGAVAVCVSLLVGGWLVMSTHALAGTLAGSLRIGFVYALAFGYLRWVYVGATRLVVDEHGVALRQPLASWRVAWTEIAAVEHLGFLSPTHRGGIGGGVKVTLRSGGSRLIPDVLAIPRVDLARLLLSRMRTRPLPVMTHAHTLASRHLEFDCRGQRGI